VGVRLAWFAAVAPAWVAYGHEARPYAVGVMLVLGLYDELSSKHPRDARVALWGCACGLWQYGTALVAVGALYAFARTGRQWKAFSCTLFATGCTGAFLVAVQWTRGQTVLADLPGVVGVYAPWGLVQLSGWIATGTPGVASSIVGVLFLAAVFYGKQVLPNRLFEASIAPLVLGVVLAAGGLYPMGSIRQSLPWSIPLMVLSAGFVRRLGGIGERVALVGLVFFVLARSPGVPEESQRKVLAALETREGPRWIHPTASPAYSVYGDMPAVRTLGWRESVDDVPYPLWLLASGRACSEDGAQWRDVAVVERLTAKGACALWLTPRSP